MAREKEGFRAQLEAIRDRFPGKELLTKKDVCRFTGLCENSVRKYFIFNHLNKITPSELARQLIS